MQNLSYEKKFLFGNFKSTSTSTINSYVRTKGFHKKAWYKVASTIREVFDSVSNFDASFNLHTFVIFNRKILLFFCKIC